MVGVQGVLFLAVALTAFLPGPAVFGSWWAGSMLIIFGSLGVFWGAKDLGRALTPMPIPNGEGLASGGIYTHIRHPMYGAVLTGAFGLAVGSGKLWTYALAVVLAVFFEVKTRMEESFLREAYPGYAEYAARTAKYVPLSFLRRG